MPARTSTDNKVHRLPAGPGVPKLTDPAGLTVEDVARLRQHLAEIDRHMAAVRAIIEPPNKKKIRPTSHADINAAFNV